MTLRYLSVCSGIEAASLAVAGLGWTAAGFAEIDPFASRVLAARFGSNLPGEPPSHNAPPNFGDFTQIDCAALGPVDVLFGGTPCQAFSIAGKRRSLEDARGNLTLAFAVLAHELVRANGLRAAFWENVPGVLSAEDNAFGCFLSELVGADDPLLPGERPARGRSNDFWRWRKAGRWPVLDDDGNETGEFVERAEGHVVRWPGVGMVAGPWARAAWRIFDAQYFGLAQRRKRVFLVVDFGGGADPAKILFERKGLRGNSAPRRTAREGVAAAVTASVGGCSGKDGIDGRVIASSGDVLHCLNAGGVGRQDFETETLIAFSSKDYGNGVGLDVAPTMRAMPHDGSRANGGGQLAVAFDLRGRDGGAMPEGPHDTANLRAASGGSSRSYVAQSFGIATDAIDRSGEGREGIAAARSGLGIVEECAPTLKAAHPNAVATRWAVRRLLPLECERLQGFPDGWTDLGPGTPDGSRYKALGNSWAVDCVRWIVRRLDVELRSGDCDRAEDAR